MSCGSYKFDSEEMMNSVLDRISDYKKAVEDLSSRNVEGYIITTGTTSSLTIKIVDWENREFLLENTPFPDVMGEEIMYSILEYDFFDENLESIILHPMRWQDYYRERIDKIHQTLEKISENI